MSSERGNVTVLLATYNGVRFLDEQLTSLNEQQDVRVEVLVNDDGSTDGTMQILEAWRAKGLIVGISQSKGIGATRAFLTLLQSCDEKEFVAFCDQDDVWEPRKLISQIQMLSGNHPQLVFSQRTYINWQNQNIGISPRIRRPISFRNALVESLAPGNTQLINNQAILVVNSLSNDNVYYYDSWVYLLINAFGECKYIDTPLIRYRIHSKNSVGLRKFNIHKILQTPDHYYNQALNFRNVVAAARLDIKKSEVAKFLKFVEQPKWHSRFVQSFFTNIYRQRKLDDFLFKCLVIIRAPK
jgi:glycosyltransferase involved in cell wall biosynthesis